MRAILRPACAAPIVNLGKLWGRLMVGKRILVAATAVWFLGTVGASAQQTGKPPSPPPTHKSSHVSRDVCATHPNLPQCS